MKTTKHKVSLCTNCSTVLDASSHKGDHSPEPGHVTICIMCAHVMTYNGDMSMADISPEDLRRSHPIEAYLNVKEMAKKVEAFCHSKGRETSNYVNKM